MKTMNSLVLLCGVIFLAAAPGSIEIEQAAAATDKAGSPPHAGAGEHHHHAAPELKTNIDAAINAALATVPGSVRELDVVEKHGTMVWVVEVVREDGHHMLVDVDCSDGTVLGKQDKTAIENIAGTATNGKLVYERHCSVCHGTAGDGQGTMGPHLIPRAANFLSHDTRDKSDAELYMVIRDGRPGTGMRPFREWLNKQEMRDVLAYVRALSRDDMVAR
jgi:high-affinity iron transporter